LAIAIASALDTPILNSLFLHDKAVFYLSIVGLIINFLKSIDVIANEGLKDEGLSKFEMRSQQVLFF
jgi:hypothetical protein